MRARLLEVSHFTHNYDSPATFSGTPDNTRSLPNDIFILPNPKSLWRDKLFLQLLPCIINTYIWLHANRNINHSISTWLRYLLSISRYYNLYHKTTSRHYKYVQYIVNQRGKSETFQFPIPLVLVRFRSVPRYYVNMVVGCRDARDAGAKSEVARESERTV